MSLEDLQFLTKKSILEDQNEQLAKKIRRLSKTLIGRKIKLKENSKLGQIPITNYDFYAEFFRSKNPEALMFPPEEYEETMTTGTMGVPKLFLLSKSFLDDVMRTVKAMLLTITFKQGKTTFERGDTFYANLAPKPFVSGLLAEYAQQKLGSYIKVAPPDQSQSFQEKTQYFIAHHDEIQIAMMPLMVLLHQIYPKIGKPLRLKGFTAFDTATEAYKDRIKSMVDCNLSGIYVSTETCSAVLPSPEHELGFIFDPRLIYCEFLPLEKATLSPEQIDGRQLVPMEEVKKGSRYRLFITPLKTELTRYDTEDIFEAVDNGDSALGTELPVLKFISRASKVIVLQNFSLINESELLLALSRSQIAYIDFTARLKVEDGRPYISIYLEAAKEEDAVRTQEKIHQSLRALDSSYNDLTRFYEYEPVRLNLLSKGSFTRMLAKKQGTPKVDRINMSQKDFDILLEK